jgi:hypothetical protein
VLLVYCPEPSQVKNSSGTWVNAVPIPGTFVCNIGDMLKLWSNGLYEPTPHRVINLNPTRSRVSVPFFYEPCFEAVVEPAVEILMEKGVRMVADDEAGQGGSIRSRSMRADDSKASGVDGGGGGLRAIRYGSHLESKVLTNFEL